MEALFRKYATTKFARFGVAPFLYYLGFFLILTWPLATFFSTRIFATDGDAFQNLWNFWWFWDAVGKGQWPYFTTQLHYPYGTTLLGHTLAPFNDVLFGLFHLVASTAQSFNLVVIFSFVATGMTMFWLCYRLTRSYAPSLLGGFIFTFSSYHFAHAYGHTNLIALEWMPLFMLFWYELLEAPRLRYAAAAAAALFLTELCSFNYLVFCGIAAAVLLAYKLLTAHRTLLTRRFGYSLGLFTLIALVLAGPLAVMTLIASHKDPFLAGHPATQFSMELFAPFVYGQIWRFGALTHGYWKTDAMGLVESSIYMPVTVTLLIVAALYGAMRRRITDWGGWLLMFLVFYLLALGPRLNLAGVIHQHIKLPYALMVRVFPILDLGGTPIRFMIMGILAAAVLSSLVLARVWRRLSPRASLAAFVALTIILSFEVLPSTMPAVPLYDPGYVGAIKSLPPGGVIDESVYYPALQMYFQTLDHHPLAFGYISKVPSSVAAQDAGVQAAIDSQDTKTLCGRYKMRYFVVNTSSTQFPNAPVAYKDSTTKVLKICQ